MLFIFEEELNKVLDEEYKNTVGYRLFSSNGTLLEIHKAKPYDTSGFLPNRPTLNLFWS